MDLTQEIKDKIRDAVGRAKCVSVKTLEEVPAELTFRERFIPLILEATESAYSEAILAWGCEHGYNFGLLDADKVRTFAEKIQRKPVFNESKYGYGSCPTCMEFVRVPWAYCPLCGQRLEWQLGTELHNPDFFLREERVRSKTVVRPQNEG